MPLDQVRYQESNAELEVVGKGWIGFISDLDAWVAGADILESASSQSLSKAMLKAGSYGQGRLFPTERGTPQGGIVSPLLSNILLTPFDREMRRRGYQLTRYADDWVVTCRTAAQARAALAAAQRVLLPTEW